MRTETLHAAFINSSPCSVEWAATAYIGNEWQWCRYPVNTKQERIFLMYHSYCISFHHMKTNISNILTGTLFIQSQLMYCTVLLLCAVFDFDLWSLAVFSSCSFKPGKIFRSVWKRCSTCLVCVFSELSMLYEMELFKLDLHQFWRQIAYIYRLSSCQRKVKERKANTVVYRSPERRVRQTKSNESDIKCPVFMTKDQAGKNGLPSLLWNTGEKHDPAFTKHLFFTV